jgi:electron transfer flavoprotein alpha subunit
VRPVDAVSQPLRIVALVKQLPKFEAMALGPDGRLVRDGLRSHMSEHCRRAVAQGVALASSTGGSCTVVTMGPPGAEAVLREAICCGADDAVLLTDPAFAGSDTTATAAALAAVLARTGPWDLVLCGRASLDADTGLVPAQLAELLGLPLLGGARTLALQGDGLLAGLEHDDLRLTATAPLPAVVSCAERLIDPCRVRDRDALDAVDAGRIRRLSCADLGPGRWGGAASRTSVRAWRTVEPARAGRVLTGPLEEQVAEAARIVRERGGTGAKGTVPAGGASARGTTVAGPALIGVVVEPERVRTTAALLAHAAALADELGGRVVALGTEPGDRALLGGADAVVALDGPRTPDAVAAAAHTWLEPRRPWAVLAPATDWGREVAGRLAVRLGAGCVGGASGFRVDRGRLVAFRPAFGGAVEAEIRWSSEVQVATVRLGPLGRPARSDRSVAGVETFPWPVASGVRVLASEREDDAEELATSRVVIGVGTGVDPADHPVVRALATRLDGSVAATRRVTDRGWMPRARQVGITGRTISPELYVAVGMSGKLNHMVGVRAAGTIVAIDIDPDAEVFRRADVGLVGDWRTVLPALVDALTGD